MYVRSVCLLPVQDTDGVYRVSAQAIPLISRNTMFQTTTNLRGYWLSASAPCARFITVVNTRYNIGPGFDVPDLAPFVSTGNPLSVKRIVVQLRNGCKMTFMVFFGRQANPGATYQERNGIRWAGDIVVFRCSLLNPRRTLVNMRHRDDIYAIAAAKKYVLAKVVRLCAHRDNRAIGQT